MQNHPLQIPITITTGYFETGDRAKDERLRIDQTRYYLNAVFSSLNIAAKGYNLLNIETGNELSTFPEFLQNVEMLSEIGIALAERLTIYSLAIKDTPTLSTAEMISFLIKDESVPEKISEALSYAINDIFNHLPPECTAQQIDQTPEYI